MNDGVKRIISQASHRNGVGGAPGIITLFEAYGHRGQFLAVTIDPGTEVPDTIAVGTEADYRMRRFAEHTIVLKMDETVAGNIAMAEGNSWRGADYYGMDIARAYRDRKREGDEWMDGYDPFDETWKPAEPTCSSDDPTNHQGETCPLHEAGDTLRPAIDTAHRMGRSYRSTI